MSPHIKFRSISFETSDGKTVVTKREEPPTDKDLIKLVDPLEHEEYFAEEGQDQHSYIQDTASDQNIIYETTTVQHVPEYSGSSHQVHDAAQQSDEEHLLIPMQPKERKRKSSLDWDEVKEQDDNKYFAMSVACSLKRLSMINNLKAKVEIFQVLEKFSARQEHEKK